MIIQCADMDTKQLSFTSCFMEHFCAIFFFLYIGLKQTLGTTQREQKKLLSMFIMLKKMLCCFLQFNLLGRS